MYRYPLVKYDSDVWHLGASGVVKNVGVGTVLGRGDNCFRTTDRHDFTVSAEGKRRVIESLRRFGGMGRMMCQARILLKDRR